MGEWGFWEYLTYGCIATAALVQAFAVAVNIEFKVKPNVLTRLVESSYFKIASPASIAVSVVLILIFGLPPSIFDHHKEQADFSHTESYAALETKLAALTDKSNRADQDLVTLKAQYAALRPKRFGKHGLTTVDSTRDTKTTPPALPATEPADDTVPPPAGSPVSDADRKAFLAALGSVRPPAIVSMFCPRNNDSGCAFAEALLAMLKEAGWPVKEVTPAGLVMDARDGEAVIAGTADSLAGARALKMAMATIGIGSPAVKVEAFQSSERIDIYIGKR